MEPSCSGATYPSQTVSTNATSCAGAVCRAPIPDSNPGTDGADFRAGFVQVDGQMGIEFANNDGEGKAAYTCTTVR